MKQIVEKCKKVQELEYQKGRLKCKSPSKAKFGREILKLLDIQEVEYMRYSVDIVSTYQIW